MKKLTPSDLAVDVLAIGIPDNNYNFGDQTRFSSISPTMGTTWNATQTFDTKGQPKDKDNDKD